MKDSFGRSIDYLRLSLTDRCNLRCRYCQPVDGPYQPAADLLSREELLRVCRAAAALGITNFKVTGGEPLMRADALDFIRDLKRLDDVRTVTLTTNGQLLSPVLEDLAAIPIDAINVSLDAVSEPLYERICGRPGAARVLEAVRRSAALGIHTKVNTVLLEENSSEWLDILGLAASLPIDVRYIERMPVGTVHAAEPVVPGNVILVRGQRVYPDLHPAAGGRGNGPARYYESNALRGRLGIIAANSEPFCAQCNRLRITSTGQLRPCLGQPGGTDLRSALRGGAGSEELEELLRGAIAAKPAGHDFGSGINPARRMNEIGG
ncbi:MAG: GTP 3',8-cyclase MoaA [Clostridia bacterium]|nr:GTP 3',8-cyclase MoaA [Clostridia bacterium]